MEMMNRRRNAAEQSRLRSASSTSRRTYSCHPAATRAVDTIVTHHSKQRRRNRNSSSSSSSDPFASVSAGLPLVGLLLLLGSTAVGVVSGQLADGGEVKMTCDNCECTGSSDAGSISVFENPSTGGKVR